MNGIFGIAVFFILLSLLQLNVAENFSQRRRRTKELEEKINKLDDATKQRIYAMKASGMPKEAIAEKISYVAGGKGTAKRIVDALHDEPMKRPSNKPKPTVKKPSNTNKKPASASKSKSTGSKK